MRADEILRIDFDEAVSKIDFSKPYDPFGKTFMKALFIGEMRSVMKDIKPDVEEELDGAEKYWNMYLGTNDPDYKEMASDELKHAGILLKKHTGESFETFNKKYQDLLKVVSAGQKNAI